MIKVNGIEVEFGQYPNGETLITGDKMPRRDFQPDWVEFAYQSDADLVRLLFVKRYLDAKTTTATNLHVRYMPYSRMDRAEGEAVFTLRHVAGFINDLGFDRVMVDEPHSDVTCAVLDRAEAQYPTIDLLPQVLDRIGFDLTRDWLFFPDAGAQKRYAKLTGYQSAVGFKHRDFATGKLTGHLTVAFSSFECPNYDGTEKVLILDDLCSYGGTFVMASERLREMGWAEVYLFVTHCENAMWDGKLLDNIDGLYCTDSILRPVHETVPGLRDGFDKVHVYTEGIWS